MTEGQNLYPRREIMVLGLGLKGEEHISKNSVAIPFLNIIEKYK